MAFQFEGAENFFVHDTIEWHSLHGQNDRRAMLSSIRDAAWSPPKSLRERRQLNDPNEVYVIHNSKAYLSLHIDDLKIVVWHARSQTGMGWTGHQIKITPTISVTFDKPVSVDEAITVAWRIKGF